MLEFCYPAPRFQTFSLNNVNFFYVEYHCRILNNKVKFENDNNSSSISLPGLAYKDFTRAGK